MQSNTVQEYNCVAKFFHWSIAGLIILNYVLGSTLDMNRLYGLHKQIGLLILVLVICRIIWRFSSAYPTHVLGLKRVEVILGTSMHHLLYVLMVLLPLSGIVMVQLFGREISFFGLFNLPQFVSADMDRAGTLAQVHDILANAIIMLVVLHVLAALKHRLFGHTEVVTRMLPKFLHKFIK